jgi:hypothetical protein
MRTFIIALILSLGLFNCTQKNYEEPNNLINRSDMIEILTDLYISQQGLQMHPTQNQDLTLELAKDAVAIMKNHNVNYNDFEKSYQYYIMNPESFKEMLNSVKDNLHNQLSPEEKERKEKQTANAEPTKL